MEDYKKKLKDEGFIHVYEWTDKPNTTYSAHKHKGKVSFYVAKGSITMMLNDTEEVVLTEGNRIDVPVGISHTGIVGPAGCTYVVAEEIEGDS